MSTKSKKFTLKDLGREIRTFGSTKKSKAVQTVEIGVFQSVFFGSVVVAFERTMALLYPGSMFDGDRFLSLSNLFVVCTVVSFAYQIFRKK